METKLFIDKKPYSNSVEIWMMIDRNDIDIYLNLDGEGNMIQTEVKKGDIRTDLKPFLELSRHYAEIFFKGIADWNSKNGILTENENLLKGKLVATEKHLDDLHRLIFEGIIFKNMK